MDHTFTPHEVSLIREIAGAGHRLLTGTALHTDLAALRSAGRHENPAIAIMADLLRDAFSGTSTLDRCDVATMGNVLDFEVSQTRRMLARAAGKNWSPTGGVK